MSNARVTDYRNDTTGAMRLELLHRHFKIHQHDPWAPLRAAYGPILTFPRWAAPVIELRADHEFDVPDITPSARMPLAGGWTYELLAHRGSADFEITDGPENDGPFSLATVLEQFFTAPDADAREALDVGELSVFPDGGEDLRWYGLRLYEPGNDGGEPWCELSESREPLDDRDTIASLEPHGKQFARTPVNHEVPRPLFAKAPDWEANSPAEGQLDCRWITTYYVPIELYTEAAGLWVYTRHHLSAHTVVPSLSTAQLQENAWQYRQMRDLATPLAKRLTHAATDRFFAPLYEAVVNSTR
jgi:hypothetical protein